jgi:hypothetical protein
MTCSPKIITVKIHRGLIEDVMRERKRAGVAAPAPSPASVKLTAR